MDTHDITDSFGVPFTFEGEVFLAGEGVTNIEMGFPRSQVVTATVVNPVSWRTRNTGDPPEEVTLQDSATVAVPSPTTRTLTTTLAGSTTTTTVGEASTSTSATEAPVVGDARDVDGGAPLSIAG